MERMTPNRAAATDSVKVPSLLDALTPVLTLIGLLALSVYLFGADASFGPNQIALVFSGAVAAGIGWKNGHRWKDLQRAVTAGIAQAMGAILILLAVGALIGSWSLAGTVPAMIYYGVKVLHPSFFYPAACVICALGSVSIGSSWTVAGTLGLGLMGISLGLDLNPAITAGAVISGAYFGDKMSPLSDTTNLAPAVTGTELFTHIRHMAWTTGPSFVIALILFTGIGIAADPEGGGAAFGDASTVLDAKYDLSLWTFVPLVVVFGLAFKRFPALPAILAGALAGAIVGAFLQPDLAAALAGDDELPRGLAVFKGVWITLFDGYSSTTGNELVDELLSRGGMSSMLNTVWLVVCALSFGALLEHTGMLARLIQAVIRAAKSTWSLITSVVLTSIGTNIVAADQYIAIVLPGRMFREEFRRRRIKARNLSRTIEDSGTLTSVLVPWNTCGAYMSATLGVATLAYLPFAFLNLINPLIAIAYGIRGFTVEEHAPGEPVPEVDTANA